RKPALADARAVRSGDVYLRRRRRGHGDVEPETGRRLAPGHGHAAAHTVVRGRHMVQAGGNRGPDFDLPVARLRAADACQVLVEGLHDRPEEVMTARTGRVLPELTERRPSEREPISEA